ncbi:kinesin-like protein Klp98A isoform X2 [Periplaneta americana]|uniref:kinesin-like protein Klp98A isoform X2 n=1 Tax=Periplaneta americana TaxID=6978 RepID=UPI0037E7D071
MIVTLNIMASVKVAVRVRPFNQRERDMEAKLIIQMDGKKTRILNSKLLPGKENEHGRERYKDFTFDHSYWSFDGADPHYASQEEVYKDLGTDVIESAFEGYNACVFAYGQTGSGKTFTMMGSPECQGLIPRICKTLFNRMAAGKEQGASYRTEVSYLEIYNERVKDLLQPSATSHSLRVREHPRFGPYVQGLSRHLVTDYSDIQELMTQGNNHRTTASTNMNDVSSRSHAIFTVMFVQAGFSNNMPSETESKVHLVDLAGSERADSSGATGQRLKEGAHINKSLVTLGSVISALAELSSSQKDSATGQRKASRSFIPYRDSVLTWLLRDSLGGNSKTIMIAAISPADCNYGETLSTLRYANRAKNIINKPTINEDPNVKLIRDLRDEISKLKALLGGNEYEMEAQPQVLAKLHQKEQQEKVLTEEWTEKWRETQKILQEQKALGLRKSGLGVVLDSDMPHLIGIDDDVLSTGVTLYHLKEGETLIGTEDAEVKQDIVLNGLGLEAEHCSVVLKDGVATLIPKQQAQCWVNTVFIDKPTRLSQGCLLLLGRTNMFRYNDPVEAAKLRKEGSRSHLNLSRLSLLSWSTPDLAWSSENLDVSCGDDEPEQLDELEQQKASFLKEKEAFKREQEEREQDWEREQREKREALEAAQKELEEERTQMEQEYAAQCRRLAQDWRRLEQHQQDNLATLKLREGELTRQRELLESERALQLSQVASEYGQVAALQHKLDLKQQYFAEFIARKILKESTEKKGCNGIKSLQTLAAECCVGLNEAKARLTDDSSPESWSSLAAGGDVGSEAIKDLVSTHCQELASLEAELRTRVQSITEKKNEVHRLDLELAAVTNHLHKGAAGCELEATKELLARRTREQLQEIWKRKQSLSLDLKRPTLMTSAVRSETESAEMHANPAAATLKASASSYTVSSSLDTADTFHTASSPCSVMAEHETTSGEAKRPGGHQAAGVKQVSDDSDELSSTDDSYLRTALGSNGVVNLDHSSSSFEKISPPSEILNNSRQKGSQFMNGKYIPGSRRINQIILQASNPDCLCVSDAMRAMKELCQRVTHQKMVIMQSLENDCDKGELHNQIAVLQELQRQYVRLELALEQHPLRPLQPDSPVRCSSEESDDMSTSADDGLSDLLGDTMKLDSEEFRSDNDSPVCRKSLDLRHRQRIMQDGLLSPVSPAFYTSVSSQDMESSSGVSLSLASPSNSHLVVHWVQIPSYVLRGAGSSTHYEYEVRVDMGGERWSLLRRYKRFRELHINMRDKYGASVEALAFPPRRFFAKNSETLARQRRKQLEDYLRCLLEVCSEIQSCPLYSCRENPTKLALLEFSAFFRKGVFESTKYGTS